MAGGKKEDSGDAKADAEWNVRFSSSDCGGFQLMDDR